MSGGNGTASASEATAIVAALERFLVDTAPAPGSGEPPQSRWLRAALEEGISARQISGYTWGVRPGLPR